MSGVKRETSNVKRETPTSLHNQTCPPVDTWCVPAIGGPLGFAYLSQCMVLRHSLRYHDTTTSRLNSDAKRDALRPARLIVFTFSLLSHLTQHVTQTAT